MRHLGILRFPKIFEIRKVAVVNGLPQASVFCLEVVVFLNTICAVECQHYCLCDKWVLEWKLDGKKKTLLILFIKPIYKIYIPCPLSANDTSVDEFLFRETQILLYRGVNMQCDAQGLAAQVIIFDMLSLALLVLLSKRSFLYLNNFS